MGGGVFCLKLIELKCLLDSRETTQMRDIDFLHEPDWMGEEGGRAVANNLVRPLQKLSLWARTLFFFSSDTLLFQSQ